MKVLVFGADGMLGRYVYSYLKSRVSGVVGITREHLDIAKTELYYIRHLLSELVLSREDIIINCAGLIKQRAETSKFDFIQVNAVFPHLLKKICKELECNVIHVTTDCVFSGRLSRYSEQDVHDAIDVYGITKSLGEPEEATVIRTSIIGEEFKNFRSLLEWVKSNKDKEVKGFTNHIWNGITCLQFAKVCETMIKNRIFWAGVKHITSPEDINKFDLVRLISNVYALNVKVIPFETEIKCDRSMVSIRDEISFEIPKLEQQLFEMKDFYSVLLKG
jgi:dTDP-4-dehydrorhamnose reductase